MSTGGRQLTVENEPAEAIRCLQPRRGVAETGLNPTFDQRSIFPPPRVGRVSSELVSFGA